jgi:hypothetical protein
MNESKEDGQTEEGFCIQQNISDFWFTRRVKKVIPDLPQVL